ncbi:oocyte zinc finger protein XlCOF8.4-like isoform X1 [Rana temporaria]|uniref:oocyte zinc finger protein XlCOF8.4-like isoform X1 n=1 Tax=Rana temporaria TaxID=8407 RepID=UPI001AAD2006|nr:oocyte zinc finger protein XlCOF8.4-like isoform X1 [Rana temporaria]
MEENCTDLTERILRLTLEIIYLLTGEDNIVAKKTPGDGDYSIFIPLHSLLVPGRNNEKKILEVIQKMIDLLTEESENWSNINVSVKQKIKQEEADGVRKELECLKGHKDLYRDVMMENQPPLTSPDGSSNGNPPEKCPRPLYSWESIQKGHTISHHHQGVAVFSIKTEVKEEEEMYVSGNQPSLKEAKTMETISKDQSSLDVSTCGPNGWNTPEGSPILSGHYNKEDNGVAQCSPGVSKPNHMVRSTGSFNSEESKDIPHSILPNVQPSLHIAVRSPDPSNPKESSPNYLNPLQEYENSFNKHDLVVPQSINTIDRRFACSECEISFTKKSHFVQHQRTHTGEKPFSCSECGKSYTEKSSLKRHLRVHTGEKPFSCTKCGKCFFDKRSRDNHLKVHTGEKTFSCPEKKSQAAYTQHLSPLKNVWWSVVG